MMRPLARSASEGLYSPNTTFGQLQRQSCSNIYKVQNYSDINFLGCTNTRVMKISVLQYRPKSSSSIKISVENFH